MQTLFRIFLIATTLILVISVENGFAGDEYGFLMGGAEDVIKDVNTQLFGFLRGILALLLFGLAIWQFVDGYINHNLANKWFYLIGIAIAVLVVVNFHKIYEGLSGDSVKVSNVR